MIKRTRQALFTVDVEPDDGSTEPVRLAVGSRDMLFIERSQGITLRQVLDPETGVSFVNLYRVAHALMRRDNTVPLDLRHEEFCSSYEITLVQDVPAPAPSEFDDVTAVDPTAPTA